MEKEKIITCLHRLIPSTSAKFIPKGCGDCSTCIQDEKNKECLMYTPITMSVMEIEKSACFFSNFLPEK